MLVETFLQKVIEVRTPYLDALTLIQIHAIERYRSTHSKRFLGSILISINGIAAGM